MGNTVCGMVVVGILPQGQVSVCSPEELLLSHLASSLDGLERFYLVLYAFRHSWRSQQQFWAELPQICRWHSAPLQATSHSQEGCVWKQFWDNLEITSYNLTLKNENDVCMVGGVWSRNWDIFCCGWGCTPPKEACLWLDLGCLLDKQMEVEC